MTQASEGAVEEEFGLFDGMVVEEEIEEPQRRKRKPYREATVRPPSRLEATASMGSIFGDEKDLWDKKSLKELYPTQEEVLKLRGSNGLKVIGTFDGGGGSLTGFAWSGWDDLMSVEFVESARETLAANYPSFMITPFEIREIAKKVAEDQGLTYGVGRWKNEELVTTPEDAKVIENPQMKNKKRIIDPSINWEETLLRIGGEESNKFRYEVTRRVFEGRPRDHKIMPLWGDDIRGMDPKAALDFLGLERGELDGYEGSPPCKSFSTSGLRELGWGRVLHYSDERSQRTDDLFLEFLRLLDGFYPKSFVAENVAGMGMGAAEIEVMQPLLDAFDDLGYTVSARTLHASDYDVPQRRTRIIFQGIRKDLTDTRTGKRAQPAWPPLSEVVYSCQDALDAAEDENTEEYIKDASLEKYELGKIWKNLSHGGSPENKAFQLVRCHPNLPVPTITATSAGNHAAAGPTHPHDCRKFTIPEYRYLFSFPRGYKFTGTIEQQGERMGRSVPPHMMKRIADCVADVILHSEVNPNG